MNPNLCRVALRPRGPLEIFDLSVELIRAHAGVFWRLAALVVIPPAIAFGVGIALTSAHGLWLLAPLAIAPALQAPFTLLGGRLLFSAEVTTGQILRELLTRPLASIAVALWTTVAVGFSCGVGLPLTLVLVAFIAEVAMLERADGGRAPVRALRLAGHNPLNASAAVAGFVGLTVWGAVVGEFAGQALVGTILQLGQPLRQRPERRGHALRPRRHARGAARRRGLSAVAVRGSADPRGRLGSAGGLPGRRPREHCPRWGGGGSAVRGDGIGAAGIETAGIELCGVQVSEAEAEAVVGNGQRATVSEAETVVGIRSQRIRSSGIWIVGIWIAAFASLEPAWSADPPPSDPPPTALDDRAYRFCHIAGANATQAHHWCELLEDLPPDRCEGLRQTCAGAVTEDPVSCGEMMRNAVGADRNEDLADAPDRPTEPMSCGEASGCGEFSGDGFQNLLRWIAAIGVALLVAVVLRVAWTTFGRRRRPDTEAAPAPAPVPTLEPDEVPDLPSDDLLASARAALAEDRLADAVMYARAAALRRLGEGERIRLHRSRTDREYVRSLRKDATSQAELRLIIAATEAVRWAGRPLTHDRARSALAAAERLLEAIKPIALVALVALGLALHAPAKAQGYDRYKPNGDAALLDVLELYGHDAGWRLRNLVDLDDEVDVLFLDLTSIDPSEAHWDHMRSWVEEGGVLVVGGDAREGLPELGEIAFAGPDDPLRLDPAFAAAGMPLPRWPGREVVGYDGAGRGLVVTESGRVAPILLLDLGAGAVVAVADQGLLWNGAFVHPDNERFVGDLVYTGQVVEGWPVHTPARVQLATWAAASDPDDSGDTNNPFGALAQAGLLAFMIQLLATWILAGLWRGWPFAPLRDRATVGRTAFVDHIAALGTRHWRLGARAYAARESAAYWLARLGPQGLQLAAQRHGYAEPEAKAWAARIEAIAQMDPDDVRDNDGRIDPVDMEELWRLTSGQR